MTPGTYPLVVEGIGAFEIRRRTLRVEIQVGAEFARLTEGEEQLPAWLRDLCEMTSAVKVLAARAPDGWDVDSMDPQEPATYEKLAKVYRAIQEAEGRFRHPPAGGNQAEGATTG